jgi:Na+/melibiose symporter-like transporter
MLAPPFPDSLWRNRAFLRLWLAQAVSGIGNRITGLAVPLTAAVTLNASPSQMATLVFAAQLPDLLFGLMAGAWVDRRRRRPLLIGADLGRAVLLAVIPIAAIAGRLSFTLLWIVAFGSAVLNLVFTLASVAVLPSIVKREQLVEANSKLAMSDSVLTLAGPGFAGALVQLVGAPKAIIADCLSFLSSAWSLGGIGSAERRPRPARDRPGWLAEIGEGVRALVQTPLLTTLAVSMGVIVVAGAIQQTVIILYMTRTLGLSPATIGVVSTATGIGALLGAALAGRVARWLGIGATIIGGAGLEVIAMLVVPAADLTPRVLPVLLGSAVLSGLATSLFGITQSSLRQRITPIHLLGRVTAARRFLIFGMAPIGAALGGLLGERIGLAPTLVVGAAIAGGGVLMMLASPIRQLQQ